MSKVSKSKKNGRSFPQFIKRLRAIDLYDEVETLALENHVSLKDLYEGSYTASIRNARRAVYVRLVELGKNPREVARIFDRNAGGVYRLVEGSDERG